MTVTDFHDMRAETPDLEQVRAEYRAIKKALDEGPDADARTAVLRRWDELRARLDTWRSLSQLHFSQDTRNEEAKKARDLCDEMWPKLTELQVELQRHLVKSRYRPQLETSLGNHLFDLWEAEILTYDPIVEEDAVRESKLSAEYTELVASATFDFEGETLNLPGMGKYGHDARRELRKKASFTVWDWFRDNGGQLDRIFTDLVQLRTSMAHKLGFKSFIDLAYKRMQRTDYGRADVEFYRDAVVRDLVPLCVELRERQAKSLGIDKLHVWDEVVHDPQGSPAPRGDHDWMIERAKEMFDQMGGGLGEFFRLMNSRHLLDLKTRDGKAGGGFCTDFPSYGVPFIFANFNGTRDDVEVFTHEMGHAFQGYSSRDKFPLEYCWPTAEACEVHSMGLEFLTWPHMEKFFGEEEAQRFKRTHLTEGLLFLPYGVAVDHFQHLVYEMPDATPAERHGIWKEMESTYLPWRDYGGIEHAETGAFWQRQLHIYKYPFYYIDYTLAQACALQFWVRSERDASEAMEAYVALCKRGGEAPFQELVRGAGLVSPFTDGCLRDVVAQARETLQV